MRIKRSFPGTVHPDRAGQHFTLAKKGYAETPADRVKTAARLRLLRANRKRAASTPPTPGPNERFSVASNDCVTRVIDNRRYANDPGEYWKYAPAGAADSADMPGDG